MPQATTEPLKRTHSVVRRLQRQANKRQAKGLTEGMTNKGAPPACFPRPTAEPLPGAACQQHNMMQSCAFAEPAGCQQYQRYWQPRKGWQRTRNLAGIHSPAGHGVTPRLCCTAQHVYASAHLSLATFQAYCTKSCSALVAPPLSAPSSAIMAAAGGRLRIWM